MILSEKLKDYRIILASASPRRNTLLKGLGFDFEVIVRETKETYPAGLQKEEIPVYLASLKADAFDPDEFGIKTLIITADTIVWLDGHIIGKPENPDHAVKLLKQLSGHTHEVFTGVCLKTNNVSHCFSSCSRVTFRQLSDEEINWYVDTCQPYDKAGAYGAQEWIGFIGIEHIEGSFFNVMGLPTQKLYVELNDIL
ncbi:MAG TPA: Maf family nucleotide pyrophosphatase [Bacteroidales bacterium]|nr:Maf family nucleotide pyrophosphatase [Bacteroidales bacterium]